MPRRTSALINAPTPVTGISTSEHRSPSYTLWGTVDSENPKPLVVLNHGYDVSPTAVFAPVAGRLAEMGFLVAVVELSGKHGWRLNSNATSFSLQDGLNDMRDAYTHAVATPGVDASRVVLHAHCYSAWMAANLAWRFRPGALVLQAPALYPDRFAHLPRRQFPADEFRRFSEGMHTRANHRTLANVHRYTRNGGHVVLVNHEFESRLTPNITRSYFRAAVEGRRSEVTIPDVTHCFPMTQWHRVVSPLADAINAALEQGAAPAIDVVPAPRSPSF